MLLLIMIYNFNKYLGNERVHIRFLLGLTALDMKGMLTVKYLHHFCFYYLVTKMLETSILIESPFQF